MNRSNITMPSIPVRTPTSEDQHHESIPFDGLRTSISSTYFYFLEHRKAAHKKCNVTVTSKVTVTSRTEK
ncbi:MAG: hypothetical protein C4583_04490 [Anaerolineaceae bacterium]|nr:MAG: hypothetical protein C4583_04490 [Anaerolineaceae bacterium]